VHPVAFLAKLNIEMNMAELLGKVVTRSAEQRSASLPSVDVWHPQLGIDVFDREWLGSAKDFIMPSGGGGGDSEARNGVGGGRGGGGGQMHELNMDILNRPKEEEGSTSGTQGDVERGQSRWGSDGRDMRTSRVGREQEEGKNSGASGV
jgi:hypothetical protein